MIRKKLPLTPNRCAIYQITVQGKVDQSWLQNYPGITTHFDGEVTTLKGILADQSALRGLLCYLWDFNLTVLSVLLVCSEGKHNQIAKDISHGGIIS